jgi:hypothetical protein
VIAESADVSRPRPIRGERAQHHGDEARKLSTVSQRKGRQRRREDIGTSAEEFAGRVLAGVRQFQLDNASIAGNGPTSYQPGRFEVIGQTHARRMTDVKNAPQRLDVQRTSHVQ